MKIVELSEGHVEQVVALWHEAQLTRPWNDPFDDFGRALRGATSSVLGALEAQRVLGAVMVGSDGHRGWLYYLAVASDSRGRGLGTALVRAGEQWLEAMGARKVQLMVRDSNAGVVSFYEKLGYENASTLVLGRWVNASQ